MLHLTCAEVACYTAVGEPAIVFAPYLRKVDVAAFAFCCITAGTTRSVQRRRCDLRTSLNFVCILIVSFAEWIFCAT